MFKIGNAIIFLITTLLLLGCSKNDESENKPATIDPEGYIDKITFENKQYCTRKQTDSYFVDILDIDGTIVSQIEISNIDSFGEKVDYNNDDIYINCIFKNNNGIYLILRHERIYTGNEVEDLLLLNNDKLEKHRFLFNEFGNPYYIESWVDNSILTRTDDKTSPTTEGQYNLFDENLNKTLYYHWRIGYEYFSKIPNDLPCVRSPYSVSRINRCISWDNDKISMVNIDKAKTYWTVMRQDIDNSMESISIKDMQFNSKYISIEVISLTLESLYSDGRMKTRTLELNTENGAIVKYW